ncbi:MAG: YhjD/YihY/BrkB family envelope integrity protein [Candidatus Omnitrophica bacterium]|nr:YhjD/YihY/BrkB family envelope integrity protein [Candidatus Omnitrophota bacterium]
MVAKIIAFFKTDIWRIRLRTLSRTQALLLKPLMIILLSLRSFDEDKCQLRASALTYYSLLSIVPIVAMAFGIAKGFGFEAILQNVLLEKFPGQEQVITQVIGFAHALLENTKGGMIAGIGVAVLFWTVIKVLGNIEQSFNDIWGIIKARSIGRKFSDYLSMMLICPVLFIIASGVTVMITSRLTSIVEKIALLGGMSSMIIMSLQILPFVVMWVLFSFLYVFMPNTKVYLKSGIVGGIIAGTLYQAVQWAYIAFQVGVAKYNAIYGSFAALPLFLAWLQISWLIVLFGAEISFVRQNLENYEFEPDCLRVSPWFKKLLTVRITQVIVKNFAAGVAPWTATRISHELEIPIRLVRQILYELVEAGIILETKESGGDGTGYQPARSSENVTIQDILETMERHGIDTIPVRQSEELKKISSALETFAVAGKKSPANARLTDIP